MKADANIEAPYISIAPLGISEHVTLFFATKLDSTYIIGCEEHYAKDWYGKKGKDLASEHELTEREQALYRVCIQRLEKFDKAMKRAFKELDRPIAAPKIAKKKKATKR